MLLLLLTHLLIGSAILLSGDRLGRRAFLVAAIAPLVTVVWAATQWSTVVGNPSETDAAGHGSAGTAQFESISWISGLDLDLWFRFDAFSLVMTLLVSGIGFLVCIYAVGYFAHIEPGQSRLAGLMTLFAAAMLGVVWADNLVALFIAWELTSITSYLLIGNDDRNPRARAAALQAIFITGGGGLALLLGLIIIGQSAGTYRLSEMIESPPSGGAVAAAIVCVLLGAFTKSAQAPFSSWLPAAMVAPTPISAYLHSATMVKAGVYLVARLSPILATTGRWQLLVLVVGSATMLIGGLRAMRQRDLKLLLAYGTVSQLGFMMLLVGTGEYKIAQAGIVLLLAHGAFKATLFMVVGVIDHQVGTRHIRELHGFGAGWMPVKVIAVVAAASMAGLPPLFGFVAKEKGIDTYLEYGDFTGATATLVVIVVGSVLTFAYSARFVLGVFGAYGTADCDVRSRTAPVPPTLFIAPAAVLTAVTLIVGLFPGLISNLTKSALLGLDPESSPSTVKLWAGFNTAFMISLGIIATGTLLAVFRRPVARFQTALAQPLRSVPSSGEVYGGTIRAIDLIARRVTRTVQSGSLPTYLLVILTTVVVLPVIPMLAEFGELPQWVENPIQLPIVAIIIGSATRCRTDPPPHRRSRDARRRRFRDGRALRDAGCPRPGAHPVRDRDPGHGVVRARVALLADPLRRSRARRRASAPAGGLARGGRRRLRLRDRSDERSRRRGRGIDLGRDDRTIQARRRGQERGQRDPRRLPRRRHHGRDHGARRRRRRRGGARPREPSARRRTG